MRARPINKFPSVKARANVTCYITVVVVFIGISSALWLLMLAISTSEVWHLVIKYTSLSLSPTAPP